MDLMGFLTGYVMHSLSVGIIMQIFGGRWKYRNKIGKHRSGKRGRLQWVWKASVL